MLVEAAFLVAGVSSIGDDPWLALVFLAGVVVWAWIGQNDLKLPFSTVLDGSQLTTRGLIGRREINLHDVTRVDRIGYIHGRYGSSEELLKLRGVEGRAVYLGLNSLPWDQRHTLATTIGQLLARPGVEISATAAQTFRSLTR